MLARHLVDRIDLDAGRLHVDQELGEAVPAVLPGRRRGAEQPDHIVGDMRIAGPNLCAVDQPSAIRLRRFGFRCEQIGASARLAHPDDEADLATANAGQDVHFDVLGRVFEQDRAALAIGDEVQTHRGVCHPEFLGHHMPLEEASLVPAIFFRPGHADPPLGADAAAERVIVRVAMAGPVGIERAGRHLPRNESPHLPAQLLALGRQAYLIETEFGGHG